MRASVFVGTDGLADRNACALKSVIMMVIAGVSWFAVAAAPAEAATLKATYLFDDTLSAEQGGAPALIAIDPLGSSGFETATVFSDSRRVWRFDGAADPPVDQGGLTLDTSGLLTPNSYSVEVVALWFGRGTSPLAPDWRHITDVEDRNTDNGFYINPNDNIELYPTGATGGGTFGVGEFRHVALTVSSSDVVVGYLDGTPEFSMSTDLFKIDNVNNPSSLMHFFLDDTTSGYPNDWASGQVALIRVWDGVLADAEVRELAADPFGQAVPEPSCLVLLLAGGAIAACRFSRRKKGRKKGDITDYRVSSFVNISDGCPLFSSAWPAGPGMEARIKMISNPTVFRCNVARNRRGP